MGLQTKSAYGPAYNFWLNCDPQKVLDLKQRVIVIHGDNYFLRKEMATLVSQKLQPEFPDFDAVDFSDESLSIEAVERELKTYPFGSRHRLIRVEIFEPSDKRVNSFMNWLKGQKLLDVFLIIRLEGRWEAPAELGALESWEWVEANSPPPYDVPKWIQLLANRRGLEFSVDALERFHEKLGDDLNEIDLNLIKLREVCPTGAVGVEEVEKVVATTAQMSVFQITELFLGKNDAFWPQTELFFNQGHSPLLLVQILCRQIRGILTILEPRVEAKAPPNMPSWQLKKFRKLSEGWSKEELRMILLRLSELEYILKSSPVRPEEMTLNFLTFLSNSRY